MNAEDFGEIGYYFEQTLKLIIYGYTQVKRDKLHVPYLRKSIHQTIKEEQKSHKAHNEIEDYLRNDLVKRYMKPLQHRHKFGLTYFSIQPGSEESKRNVKKGIVDIRIENTSATCLDGTHFIFECKRLNKYQNEQNEYIEHGMCRFITRQYHAESEMSLCGMIAFIEVDLEKHKQGVESIDKIVKLLNTKIGNLNGVKLTEACFRTLKKAEVSETVLSSLQCLQDQEFCPKEFLDTVKEKIGKEQAVKHKETILKSVKKFKNTLHSLQPYPLHDEQFQDITNFDHSYVSRHIRSGDHAEIAIHHLLLDYYNILVP
jgi:hypothetical protein